MYDYGSAIFVFVLFCIVLYATLFYVSRKQREIKVEQRQRERTLLQTTTGAPSFVSNKKPLVFHYGLKLHLMTRPEEDFFRQLDRIVSSRYYIFPQIHISSLVDEKVYGQNWQGAFRHINGKSVDYVLCDRHTFKPVYAIELDDTTHQRSDRVERDHEVERIFNDAGLALVRFSGYPNISDRDIIKQLANAHSAQMVPTASMPPMI